MKQDEFKKLLQELGFALSEGYEDGMEVYFDDKLFGDFWVYFSGECDTDYPFKYDATGAEIDLVDFIQRGIRNKEIEFEDLVYEYYVMER